MLHQGETFFTRVGCMDGRVQEPVAAFGRKKFGAQYPDTITEAGLVGLLAKKTVDPNLLTSLKKKISISLKKHHSKGIVVYGHEDCAGNPVSDEKQRDDIRKSVAIIKQMVGGGTPVIGSFIWRSQADSDRWEVEEIYQYASHCN